MYGGDREPHGQSAVLNTMERFIGMTGSKLSTDISWSSYYELKV